jgi:ribose 5-phosphate isomerase A
MSNATAEAGKRAAAEAAASLIENGMVLGLGTGSTMAYVLDALARRIATEGLSVRGVPTSEWTGARATALGIPLTDLAHDPVLDLAIDGADDIERGRLRLIKGLGGALLREKIVAEAARRFVVVADASKLVDRLGQRSPLPIEIVKFGHDATQRRIGALGLAPAMRLAADKTPFVTDNGNYVLDASGLAALRDDPAVIEASLRDIAGVIGTGLFLHGVERAVIGHADGHIETLMAMAAHG